ncbi:MAG: DUF4345 family protein [Gammaproteobacteria bacterium]|nr:DUF4345 family protein [Gammaproteobacteria bacterium]
MALRIGAQGLNVAERLYLAIMGLALAATGLFALVSPDTMAASLGIAALGVVGDIEIRAVYGGLTLGWGLLLLLGLRVRVLALSGLAFTAIGGGCLLLTRFITALTFGASGFSGVVTTLILIEVGMVGLAYVLLRHAIRTGDLPEVIQ